METENDKCDRDDPHRVRSYSILDARGGKKRASGVQPPAADLLDRRMACLSDELGRMRAVTAQLAMAEPRSRGRLHVLRREYRPAFEQAFADAQAELSSKDRNLLYYHLVGGLGIIGKRRALAEAGSNGLDSCVTMLYAGTCWRFLARDSRLLVNA